VVNSALHCELWMPGFHIKLICTCTLFAMRGLLRSPAPTRARILSTSLRALPAVERMETSDPAPFLTERCALLLPEDRIRELWSKGFVVLEDALQPEEASELQLTLDILTSCGALEPTPEASIGVRDDAIRWQSEEIAPPAVASVIVLLKGLAAAINACSATVRPLGVPSHSMLASYPPGGQYRVHSDNSRREELGGRRGNERCLTAIAYANLAPWDTVSDGGALRLFQRSSEFDLDAFGGDAAAACAALCDSWATRRQDGDDGMAFVDIAPLAGRIVVFDSTLCHEVRASTSRPRRAVSLWLYSRDEEGDGSVEPAGA